jgi:hypothetical protein
MVWTKHSVIGFIISLIIGKAHRCTGTEALYRQYGPWGGGVRGIALPFLDHGTRRL